MPQSLADAVGEATCARMRGLGLLPLQLEDGSTCYFSSRILGAGNADDRGDEDRVLVLIPGRGRSGPGIWSLQLIVEMGFFQGSMLPVIDRAITEGFGVVVCNPNAVPRGKAGEHIVGAWSEARTRLARRGCRRPRALVLAHSAGGWSAMKLAHHAPEDVCAMAFADSMHKTNSQTPSHVLALLRARAVNFVSGPHAKGTVLHEVHGYLGCMVVASSATRHAAVVSAAIDFIFDHLTSFSSPHLEGWPHVPVKDGAVRIGHLLDSALVDRPADPDGRGLCTGDLRLPALGVALRRIWQGPAAFNLVALHGDAVGLELLPRSPSGVPAGL